MTTNPNYSEEQMEENNLSTFLEEADKEPEESEMDYEEHISDHTGITSDDSVSLYLNERVLKRISKKSSKHWKE